MAETENHDEVAQLNRLLKLAQTQDQASRKVVFENVVDLFLSAEGRLSDRERALMTGIIGQLLHEMEMRLRRDLAQRLSALEAGPHDLIVALANDEIEVARPILSASKVLSDSDLVEVVRHRSSEHQLAVAMRAPLSADVSQALIDQGDENVIERLLKNRDATLSRRALEYLVAEAQRVGRFQEPVLTRPELPADLAHRLFWYVSAALRSYVLEKFTIDEATVDDYVQDSARAVLSETPPPSADRQAAALVERLAETDELNERFLIGALRGGKIAAFVAGLAKLTRLNPLMVRRLLYDPNPEGLAVMCKAVGFDRSSFGSIFLLTRQGTTRVVKPEIVTKVMGFYDQLAQHRARTALRYWRADRDYLHATAKLAETGARAP
jgi:uncharacterized protein (DUF2336 family)